MEWIESVCVCLCVRCSKLRPKKRDTQSNQQPMKKPQPTATSLIIKTLQLNNFLSIFQRTYTQTKFDLKDVLELFQRQKLHVKTTRNCVRSDCAVGSHNDSFCRLFRWLVFRQCSLSFSFHVSKMICNYC